MPVDPQESSTDRATWDFDPRRFHATLWRDRLLRTAGWLVAGAGLLVSFLGGAWALGGLVVAVGAFLALSFATGKAAGRLGLVGLLVEGDLAVAEDALAGAWKVWPLPWRLRLALAHRLAQVRHRQRRFDQSLRIAQTVRRHDAARNTGARPHLLLMTAEAALRQRDPYAAHAALSELFHHRLSLEGAMQRLALQTLYEVAVGADAHAVSGLAGKVSMLELLPAPQAAAAHAALATAAERVGATQAAAWLRDRAELLGPQTADDPAAELIAARG